MENRSQDIFSNLKENGVDVYFPGQKQGQCTAPYVVVKYTGSSQIQGLSSVRATYNLLCYVPALQYSILENYIAEIKAKMKLIEPMIMPANFASSSFYDDEIKGHMVSIEYTNNRKL